MKAIYISALALLFSVMGWFGSKVWSLATAYAQLRNEVEQCKKESKRDSDGLGALYRRLERKSERRQKQMIHAAIDASPTPRQKDRYARLLTDDSWEG